MILILIVFLLFLGIVFFQSTQGTFSALIMLVLTVLSAAVAVNFYGPISQAHLMEHIPDYADAVTLAVLFTVTLVVLRSLADYFIRCNVVISLWPDRILAGAMSVPSALILIGMAVLAFEMLPFDSRVLLFERYKHTGTSVQRADIFPYADNFTRTVLAGLSRGSLQNTQKFGQVHPDWPGEVSAQRIAVQRESRHAVMAEGVKVTQVWRQQTPLTVLEYTLPGRQRYGEQKLNARVVDQRPAESGYYYLAVRMELNSSAADPDGHHRFGWGQVRMVGFLGGDRTSPMNVYAIGVRDPDQPNQFNYMRIKVPLISTENNESDPGERHYGMISRTTASGPMSFDVVFEVPEGFTPWFLEYKRWARAGLPKIAEQSPELSHAPVAAQPTQSPAVGQTGSGMHVEYRIDSERTKFTDELPFTITTAARSGRIGTGDAELANNRYLRGRISGMVGSGDAEALDARTAGRMTVVGGFEVPSNKRLLRMECQFTPAQSQALRSIFTSVQGVMQKKAVSRQGQVYLPVGQYAMVQEDQTTQRIELVYDPEVELHGRLEPLRDIQLGQLHNKNVRIGFLFLIDPGTEMDHFEVGGNLFQAQSLRLTAPR